MRLLRIPVLLSYVVGAALLVMGHVLDDANWQPASKELSVSAYTDTQNVTVWAPLGKEFEMEAALIGRPPLFALSQAEECVRPAWGMFLSTVMFFLIIHSSRLAAIDWIRHIL